MRREVGVKVDECLVIEGCESDDKVVLGGKDAFLSHFCTFFNFNICTFLAGGTFSCFAGKAETPRLVVPEIEEKVKEEKMSKSNTC